MVADYCCARGTELAVERNDLLAHDGNEDWEIDLPASLTCNYAWRIHCSVSDFNKTFFSNPLVWTSFIRVGKYSIY